MGFTKRNKRCIPKKRYATFPKGMKKKSAKKREKMHTQRRYATHPQGVSKREREREREEKETIAHTKNITRKREFI